MTLGRPKKSTWNQQFSKTAILYCFWGQVQSRELFGQSVIEYLNYDPRSGHDTHDQKVLLKGRMDLNKLSRKNIQLVEGMNRITSKNFGKS